MASLKLKFTRSEDVVSSPTGCRGTHIAIARLNHLRYVTIIQKYCRAGILTCCPSTTLFSLALGPPNPETIIVAQETLSFRWTGFSPVFLLLMPTFSLLCPPPHLTDTASVEHRMLLYLSSTNVEKTANSVSDLAPIHFRRTETRPVSYYAFFKGWLLLSQPPGCLSCRTTFDT